VVHMVDEALAAAMNDCAVDFPSGNSEVEATGLAAAVSGIPVRLGPLIDCGTYNEPSFTLLLVQRGSIPKAVEFVLNTPADVPRAQSKLVKTREIGGTLGRR
jgi:hypothetical protein